MIFVVNAEGFQEHALVQEVLGAADQIWLMEIAVHTIPLV